jgi:hypothetical protein
MSKDASLTGRWHGRYTYGAGMEGEAFEAEIAESGGAIQGDTYERAEHSDGFHGMRHGRLDGVRTGAAIAFVKRYAPGHGHQQPIRYEGGVSADGTEIEGDWFIAPGARGRFLMIRDSAKPQDIAAKAEENSPLGQ